MGAGATVLYNLRKPVESSSPFGYTYDFRPEHHPDRLTDTESSTTQEGRSAEQEDAFENVW